jgi:hypothetical protein
MVMMIESIVRTEYIPVWVIPVVPCHGIMIIRPAEIIVDAVAGAGGIP